MHRSEPHAPSDDRAHYDVVEQRVFSAAPSPRLLDLHVAARYLGVSYWTVRDWVLAGVLPSIQMPALRAREGARQSGTLRRRLVDVRDLDAFIDARKTA